MFCGVLTTLSYNWMLGLLHEIAFTYNLTHHHTSTKTGEYTLYIYLVGSICSIIFNCFIGYLKEKIGLRNLLIICFFANAGVLLVISLSSSFTVFLICIGVLRFALLYPFVLGMFKDLVEGQPNSKAFIRGFSYICCLSFIINIFIGTSLFELTGSIHGVCRVLGILYLTFSVFLLVLFLDGNPKD